MSASGYVSVIFKYFVHVKEMKSGIRELIIIFAVGFKSLYLYAIQT
jgi:hypothetical protein